MTSFTTPLDFRPVFGLYGSHLQTIGGVIARSGLSWPYASEDIVIRSDDDDVELLVRASWQTHRERASSPALVLIHGLEGSDRAHYVLSTGILAYRMGWHVLRMNMRGCGDAMALCPRLYNAGLTPDLVSVARWLEERVSRFAVCGFSLGANLTLLTLAREKSRLTPALKAAVAVCPPLDMSQCADALEWRSNGIYQFRFVHSLKRTYRVRQRLDPSRYEAGRERSVRTLRAFDDVITAYYGGYRDAEHYYQSVSTGPRLEEIDHPTLVLSSTNDPFIPLDTVACWPHSSAVQLELIDGAGHVGFVGVAKAPRSFWAADRVLAFLNEVPSLADP